MAIDAAATAGLQSHVTTVSDRTAFQKILTSSAVVAALGTAIHRTSPIIFDQQTATNSLTGATLIGGCDDLKRRIGAATTVDEQRAARQNDTSSRTPAQIAAYFHQMQKQHSFVVWVLWRGVW